MTTSTTISVDEILQLIDVQKPYFALEELVYHSDGLLTALIPIQQIPDCEPLPISNSEAGRHLAVLGSCVCALSLSTRQRYYYLASGANATRDTLDSRKTDYLIGSARCMRIDQKTAQAEIFLHYPDGTLLSKTTINYHLLHPSIFERIYKNRAQLTPEITQNPYTKVPSFVPAMVSSKQMLTSVSSIKVSDCAGHFPGLPIIPVSVLFGMAIRLAIHLLQTMVKNPQAVFCVKECTSEAKNPASPGEKIDFEAELIYADTENSYVVRISAFTNCNCCVGVADLVLCEVIPVAQDKQESEENADIVALPFSQG